MTSPLPFPDWVPWWVHLVVLLAILLFALLFLTMPFSVFGVKTRLEQIDARLDEIQGEIRSLSLRLPEPVEEEMAPVPRPGGLRPPIPPAPAGIIPAGNGRGRGSASRMEPRLR